MPYPSSAFIGGFKCRESVQRVEGETVFDAHGEVAFDLDAGEPAAEGAGGGAEVFFLGGEAAVRVDAEELAVEGAAVVADQDDPLELVRADEEAEMRAGGVVGAEEGDVA